MEASIHSLKTSLTLSQRSDKLYTGGPVVVSSNEQLLACGCDHFVKVIDIKQRKENETITALAFHPNNEFLVSSSATFEIRVWDLETSKCVKSFLGHQGPVTDLAFEKNGYFLGSSSADGSLKVWDCTNLKKGSTTQTGGLNCTHFFKTAHEGMVVRRIIFHSLVKGKDKNAESDLLWVISSGDDCVIRIWDLIKNTYIREMKDHLSVVPTLMIHQDYLITAGRDKVLNLWNMKYLYNTNNTGKFLLGTVPTFESMEGAAVLIPTENLKKSFEREKISSFLIATGGELGKLRIFDLFSNTSLVYEENNGDDVIRKARSVLPQYLQLIRLPQSQQLIAVNTEQNILFFNTNDSLNFDHCIVGFNDEIFDSKIISSSIEGEISMAVATNSPYIKILHLYPQKETDQESIAEAQLIGGHSDLVLTLDLYRPLFHNPLLISGSKDMTVKVWDLKQGKLLCNGVGHTDSVSAVAFSKKIFQQNSYSIFGVSGSNDKTLKKWVFQVQVENAQVISVKSECVGTVLAHEKDINSVAVSPNDKLIASASQDKLIKLWDANQITKLISSLKGHRRGVWSVEFSPLDQCLLSSSADATIRIWSLKDYSCLRTLQDHAQAVVRAQYFNKGTQCISSGADGVLKIWSIKNSECISTLTSHPASSKIWALGVTDQMKNGSDGGFFVSGGTDSSLFVWQENTEKVSKDAAVAMQQRVLQLQELEQLLAQKNYKKALQMAFVLDQPYKLLQLIEDISSSKDLPNGQTCHQILEYLISSLSFEHLEKCLQFVRDWNTTARHSAAAQLLLSVIFKTFSPKKLMEISSLKSLLEAILPYTERHFQRFDRLLQKSFLLDYTLQRMNSIILPHQQQPEKVEENSKQELLDHTDNKSADHNTMSSDKKKKNEESTSHNHVNRTIEDHTMENAEGESDFNIPQKHVMEREEELAPKKQKNVGFKSSFGRKKF